MKEDTATYIVGIIFVIGVFGIIYLMGGWKAIFNVWLLGSVV